MFKFVEVDKVEDAILMIGDDPLGLNDLSYDELCTMRLGLAHSIERLEFEIEQHERRLRYGVTI